MNEETKPVDWVGSSYKDFRTFPEAVQDPMGYALYRAQIGKRHQNAKPLKGFGGAGVVEIVEDFRSDTYRAVYTVRFPRVIYMLHAFQKKAKKGLETSRHEIEVIRKRLRAAEDDHRSREGESRWPGTFRFSAGGRTFSPILGIPTWRATSSKLFS